MQRCPPPRPGQMVEVHSHPSTSLLEGRVLVVGWFSSFCSYQGGDRVLAQKCIAASPMRSNWWGVPDRIPFVGCSRNIINLGKQIKGKSTILVINISH